MALLAHQGMRGEPKLGVLGLLPPPSRFYRVATIQRFKLCRVLAGPSLGAPQALQHAVPRLGNFSALATIDSRATTALLTLFGRSGASPHQN